MSKDQTTDADKIIAHLKECRRNQADTILQLLAALEAIRDMAIKAIPAASAVWQSRSLAGPSP